MRFEQFLMIMFCTVTKLDRKLIYLNEEIMNIYMYIKFSIID